MRLVVVGGLARSEPGLRAVAEAHGHALELHDGTMSPRSRDALEARVARAELVVLVTETNSHNAVHATRKVARAHGVPVVIVRKLGATRLAALLEGHAELAAATALRAAS